MKTIVGYAGGTKEEPTYRSMGDHTEVVRVVFDPHVISYQKLLSTFWAHHNPASQAGKRQYWNAVFYENVRQETLAKESLEEVRKELEGSIETRVLPVRSFTRAETYHQKYHLQQNDELMAFLNEQFSSTDEMFNSELATRANAYVAGAINEKQFRARLDDPLRSSLPESVREQVKTMMCGAPK